LHHATAADGAQSPFEENAVKTCYDALDSALVPFQKSLHGRLRECVGKYTMPEQGHGAIVFSAQEVRDARFS
jgi:hypothetical protein